MIRKIFHSQDKSVVMFERNYHSPHFQLQMIPIPRQNSMFLENIFTRFGKKYELDFERMNKGEPLSAVFLILIKRVPPKAKYFYVEFDDGTRLIHLINGRIPIQFGRYDLA